MMQRYESVHFIKSIENVNGFRRITFVIILLDRVVTFIRSNEPMMNGLKTVRKQQTADGSKLQVRIIQTIYICNQATKYSQTCFRGHPSRKVISTLDKCHPEQHKFPSPGQVIMFDCQRMNTFQTGYQFACYLLHGSCHRMHLLESE